MSKSSNKADSLLVSCLVVCFGLCRSGIFSSIEHSDVSILIRRLSRTVSLMIKPSPLDLSALTNRTVSSVNPDETGTQASPVQLTQVHCHIIKYCIDNSLPELLYYYADFWK